MELVREAGLRFRANEGAPSLGQRVGMAHSSLGRFGAAKREAGGIISTTEIFLLVFCRPFEGAGVSDLCSNGGEIASD